MSDAALTPAAPRGASFGAIERVTSSPTAIRLSVVVLFVVLWEISARLWGNPMFAAPASEVLISAFQLLKQPDLLRALAMVLAACVAAFILSVVLGTLVGLLVGSTSFGRDAFFPIILMLYATPQSPFLPLITLMFGFGIEAKIVYGFTHGVFPMAVTIVAGLQGIDPRLMAAAKSMGASPWQRLIRITVPFILQSLFTGMRMTMAVVLLGVLLSEIYISNGGVGFFTRMYSNRFEPANLFALISMLAIIAVTLNETCRRVEMAYSAWRASD